MLLLLLLLMAVILGCTIQSVECKETVQPAQHSMANLWWTFLSRTTFTGTAVQLLLPYYFLLLPFWLLLLFRFGVSRTKDFPPSSFLTMPCAFLFRQSQEEGGTGTAANRSRQSLLQTHTRIHSLCSPHTPSFAHSLSLSLSFDQSTSFSCTFFLQFLQFFSWTPHTTKQNKENRKQKAAAAATTSAFI